MDNYKETIEKFCKKIEENAKNSTNYLEILGLDFKNEEEVARREEILKKTNDSETKSETLVHLLRNSESLEDFLINHEAYTAARIKTELDPVNLIAKMMGETPEEEDEE